MGCTGSKPRKTKKTAKQPLMRLSGSQARGDGWETDYDIKEHVDQGTGRTVREEAIHGRRTDQEKHTEEQYDVRLRKERGSDYKTETVVQVYKWRHIK